MAETSQELLKGLGFITDPTKAEPAQLVGEGDLARGRQEVDQRGFFESIAPAIKQDSIIAMGVQGLTTSQPPIPAEEGVSEFTDEWLEKYVNPLNDKRAYEEVMQVAIDSGLPRAEAVATRYQVEQERLKELGEAGWKGVTAQVMVQLTEEVAAIAATSAAVSTLTGPAAPATATALTVAQTIPKVTKAYSKLRAFGTGAAIGSLEAGAFEYARALNRYDYTGQDVLLAMGLGTVIGGSMTTASTAFAKRSKAAELSIKVGNNQKLTVEEQAFYDVFNNDATTMRMIKKELDTSTSLNNLNAEGVQVRQSLGKQLETGEAFVPQLAGQNIVTEKTGLDFLRRIISTNFKNGTSKLDTVRGANAALVMNSAGFKTLPDGTRVATKTSASEHQEIISAQFKSPYMVMFYNTATAWKKRTGGTLQEFQEKVSRSARGIGDEIDPEVKQLAELVVKQQDELARMAIKDDAAGFTQEILGKHGNYLPRIFNDVKLANMRKRFGTNTTDVVAKLVETAIRKAQPNIEANVRQALANKGRKKITDAEVKAKVTAYAKGYANGVLDPSKRANGRSASEMELEDLRKVMGEVGKDIDQDTLDDIIEAFSAKAKVKGHPRSKPRLLLDENTTIQVKNEATGDFETIGFSDILEENITALHNQYIFQLGGAIGLARRGIDTNQVNSGFDTVRKAIEEEGALKGLTSAEISDSLRGIEFAYDGIKGRLAKNQDVSNKTAEFNMALRAFSFSVNMGMAGMSALMELSNALFETGTMVMLRSMPAYKDLMTKAASGDLPDNVVQELVEALGLGNEVAMGRFNNFHRYENSNLEGVIEPNQGRFGKFAGEAQQKVAYWSGLQGVTQTLRRLSMLQYTNAWGEAIKKGKMPFHEAKLEQLGLDKDSIDALMRDMKEHSTISDSGKVTKLNISAWSPEGREAFQASGFKEARQSVQEMNIGSSNAFLRGEVGKTYFQFLSFPLAAMEQQAARLAVRGARLDVSAAKIVLAAGLQGSLLYTTRVYMNAAGRSDRKEYIKRQMAPDRFLAGALGQIGAFGLFSVIYGTATSIGSGQNSGGVMTPAVISIGESVGRTGYNVFDRVFNGEEWTENDWRKFLRLAPAQSLYGVRQLFNYASNKFAN